MKIYTIYLGLSSMPLLDEKCQDPNHLSQGGFFIYN